MSTSARPSTDLTSSELLDHFRTMALIRHFEEAVSRAFRDGRVHGFVHVSTGQEAVAVGACSALEDGDFITATHRGHGQCIAKGADPLGMMAELFGRSTGTCGGKGGSMHIADPRLGILGANGIVGAGIPIAAGAGLSARVRGTGRVSVAFFGEGAVHTGAFHEGVSLSVAWSLPVVLVCENNGYAEFTASTSWRGPTLMERAVGYAVPAVTVDGNDVLAVREAVLAAAADARAGDGPRFVEARTYRLGGHYEGDPERYRPEDERGEWADRDPLAVMRRHLGDVPEELLDRIEREASDHVAAIVAEADAAPYPHESAALEHVHG